MKLTDCRGAEVAFEAVGMPQTFESSIRWLPSAIRPIPFGGCVR